MRIALDIDMEHMHDKANDLDTIVICPYCGKENQLDPPIVCCGEVHAERHYYDFSTDMFVNPKTGEQTDESGDETLV